MESAESLQAKREAQAALRRQSVLAGVVGVNSNQFLYSALVPPPGADLPRHVEESQGLPAATEVPVRPQGNQYNAGSLDYTTHSGVFYPVAQQVPQLTSPTGPTETAVAPSATPNIEFIVPPVRTANRGVESLVVAKMTPAQIAALQPKGQLLQTYVLRERGGILSNPKYRMFLEGHETFIMASRKRGKKQTSNYLLSLDMTDLERESDNCFAKVRANFTGTEFMFYAVDQNSKKELGAVIYEINPGGIRGPRRMKVIIPKVAQNGVAEEWTCTSDEGDQRLIDEYKQNPSSSRITVLENKAPQWNEAIKGYQLNFGGRIGVPSVKNFQLCDTNDPDQSVVMQFGKWSEDRFSLDFRYPINSTQAFCVALTSFDNKLLCE